MLQELKQICQTLRRQGLFETFGHHALAIGANFFDLGPKNCLLGPLLSTQANDCRRIGRHQSRKKLPCFCDDDEIDEVRRHLFTGIQNIFQQRTLRATADSGKVWPDARASPAKLMARHAVLGE